MKYRMVKVLESGFRFWVVSRQRSGFALDTVGLTLVIDPDNQQIRKNRYSRKTPTDP